MQNLMKKEKTKSFIKTLQDITGAENFDNNKLLPMIEQMNLMGNLIEDFVATENEEELLQIGEKMKRCEAEGQKISAEFFNDFNISLEELHEKFKNPEILAKRDQVLIKHAQEKMMRINDKLSKQNQNIVKKKGKNKKRGREKV